MGKTIVITGGERGLGLELAKKYLLDKQNLVYSLDLKKESEQENKKFMKTDITNEAQVVKALKKIDKIDILIHNAGIMIRGETFDTISDDFDKIFSVNVKGAWIVTKHSLEKLSKNAKIAIISSRHSALPSNPGIYGLTKKTLEHLGELIEKNAKITSKSIQVKTAIIGPFDSKLSRTGYSKEKYAKRKNLLNIVELTQELHKFIDSKKKKINIIKKVRL